ncbi:MAG: hypothetical protein WD532_00340 [Acidimicrobiia bacterium]
MKHWLGTLTSRRARQGLSPTEARILDEYRQGSLNMQHFDANHHIAYARLRNAGLVDENPGTSHC